ncbi:MAG: OmpA family protein [Cyclobacteriaceae bacterium]|nr:OmpA family protein [Cyclobacteriaceae bacterium]
MKLFPIILISVISFSVSAQQKEITARGKIMDAITKKGIKAKIFYKSYPTGSLTGRFNDSTFSFPIFGSSKYQITADAEGYISGTALVDPKDIDLNNNVVRDIVLTKKGETIVLDHLIFEQGKAIINPKSFPGLDEVVVMMKDNSKLEIQLEGHTDNQGNPKKNMELSQERVDNVKKYIVSKGVAKDRVKTKAFGGTKPILNANTPEARALNRRVEMRILKD